VGLNHRPLLNSAIKGAEIVGIFLSGAADRSHYLTTTPRITALTARSPLANCGSAQREWLDAVTEIIHLSSP
jgi:hypothetical protein